MTLRFQEIFLTEPYFVFDGPMETRIKYGTDILLDKDLCIFKCLYQQNGVNALAKLYRQDTQIAEAYNYPIILNAPTFRASERYIKSIGYKVPESVEKINIDAVKFVRQIREQFPNFNEGVFVAGPIGPKFDAYTADDQLSIEEAEAYHLPQALALAKAGADILSIATMSNKNEAIGAARAAAKADRTYGLGMLVTAEGTLLDGTRIEDLIAQIDAEVSPRPFFYAISCTHVSVAEKALSRKSPEYQRILGIKANGSCKSPAQLAKSKYPIADKPEKFGQELVAFGKEHQMKIYGGCCGTDHRHLQAICHFLKTSI